MFWLAASAALVTGGTPSGLIVGVLLLGIVSFLLLCLLLFLSIGITFGKLLLYKEVHQEGQIFHWYQEIIRVTLGPGKRGQWTWKDVPNSVFLTMFGPLFEDLRGPPKYMLSQISGGNPHKRGDRIIASDDEIEDAEAPFIQKLFGILRIYYTLLESVKRVLLGIVAGAYIDDWSSKSLTITKQLDGAKSSFLTGLKVASFGFLLLVLPQKLIKKLESKFPSTQHEDGAGGTGDATSSAERYRSSGSGNRSSGTKDRPWMKQLRELAKSSFSKQGSGAPNDPSTSSSYPNWSGFWSKRSGSSSLNSPSESKPKPKGIVQRLRSHFCSQVNLKPLLHK
ncbi:hypothetical protein Patl1_18061 [Pistacia atlantica]|uniref:Uncharacterized protein n=1 Tax=Pistacia atlantica TaxID=434234 RepID=A0ACC1C2B9_9ROSI|nr:hypothetical protein Patl1_18061 [Pistacia atlantica]